jgi:hypothetical protein
MKKLYAAILIFAFAACYIPAVKTLLHADSNTCWVSIDEEQHPENKKDNTGKKEMKGLWGNSLEIPLQATVKFSYLYSSHFWANNLAADVLTPPPNQA